MNNNKTIIFPMGFCFWFLFILYFFFIAATVCLMIFVLFIKNSDIYYNWIALLAATFFAVFMVLELIKLFKQAPIVFDENNCVVSCGKNSKAFPAFKLNCEEIIDYKIRYNNLSICIELFNSKKSKKIINVIQFTKKQISKILTEIQKRGGIQNKETNIDFKKT